MLANLLAKMAEGQGFEPWKDLTPCRFSRPVHSTTLPTLRGSVGLRRADSPVSCGGTQLPEANVLQFGIKSGNQGCFSVSIWPYAGSLWLLGLVLQPPDRASICH
jgi:hypothetical protein